MAVEDGGEPMTTNSNADRPRLGFTVVPVADVGGWCVRVIVDHVSGPVIGWAPVMFWSRAAANVWLTERLRQRVQPAVRECEHGPGNLAIAVLRTIDDEELVVSEPVPRVQAAGVAALFAAEFRARKRAERF